MEGLQLFREDQMSWVPWLLIIYNFCANLANDIYLPSMPALARDLGTSSNTLQITMTAWFAGVAIPQLFFGPLTDKIGRRPVLIIGGICFLVATLICAITPNIWLLIISRFFQGVGVCSLNVSTFSILTDLYHYKERIRIMNKISICGTVAPLLGPILGGYIFVYLGWRANFYIIFVIGFLSVLGLSLKLPESNLQLNQQALNLKKIFSNYYSLIVNKDMIRCLLPYCTLLAGLVAYLTVAPFIIINKLKISPEFFGYTQLPIFGTYILGSLFISYIVNDNKKWVAIGLRIVLCSAILLLVGSYWLGNNIWCFILPMLGYALGFSFCATTLLTDVMDLAGFAKGSAAALLGFGMALGCMIATSLVSVLYDGTVLAFAKLMITIGMLASFFYVVPHLLLTKSKVTQQDGIDS